MESRSTFARSLPFPAIPCYTRAEPSYDDCKEFRCSAPSRTQRAG